MFVYLKVDNLSVLYHDKTNKNCLAKVMKMKKIVLIEPVAAGEHVYSTVRMPRLGLPLLGTNLRDAGYDVSIFVSRGLDLPWPKIMNADLVGISTTTSTSPEAYRMASYLRSHGVPVIIGGIHATFLPDEALDYADYVLRGEADSTFLQLVRVLEEGKQPVDVPGVSYRDGEKIIHNPCPAAAEDVDSLPSPDFSLFKGRGIGRVVPVMTSRGCPFNCVFCCVTEMFGRRYRYRSRDKILNELSRFKNRNIFFCDDNFCADSARSKELLRAMLDCNIKFRWWGAQVRVEVAKDQELLDLMRRAGCGTVFVGLESINPDTLESYNKRQSVEDIRECIERFHEHGIRVHGMFIFGSDNDTVQTVRDTVDFALETRIDTVQFMILTPLPGTPLFKQLEEEGRLLTRDWGLYDGHHVVHKPKLLSPYQLQYETIRAYKRFYSLRHVSQNVRLTGVGSALYRMVGFMLVRKFEKHNRWYDQVLKRLTEGAPRPKLQPVFFRKMVSLTKDLQVASGELFRIYVAEGNGVVYLKIRGLVDRIALKELNKAVRSLFPQKCHHVVINTVGLRYASDKAGRLFSRFLDRLGERARRLQIISAAGENLEHFKRFAVKYVKRPQFELILR